MSEWLFENSLFTSDQICDSVAFVYLITNNVNGKKYVGKKSLQSIRHKRKKGAKRRTRIVQESDWKSYWGSSDALKADVEKYGEDAFTREILYLCKTKGEASYLEAKEQIERKVLFLEEYYNGIINCRVSISHVKNLNPNYW